MSAYATPEELRNVSHLGQSGDDAAKFTPLLERASRIFDRLVGVADETFNAAGGSATARTFYGKGTAFLQVGDYVAGSLTTVTMPSGYTVPSYAQVDGYLLVTDSNGLVPITSGSGSYWWPEGVPVVVTARWGALSIPPEVKQFVVEVAIAMWRGADPAFAKTAAVDGTEIKQGLTPVQQSIVDRYRTKRSAVIA